MAVEKKLFPGSGAPKVKINNREGDLSKKWYVHWREEGQTLKKYGKINHIDNFSDRSLALKKLQEQIQTEINNRFSFSIPEQLYENIERLKKLKKWRKKTYQTHKSKLDKFVRWLNGRAVNPSLIQMFLDELLEKKHGVTYNRYCAEMRRWFKDIGKPELMPIVDRAKAKSRPAKYLQKHEVELIRAQIESADPDLWLAIQYMYNCAIRPGELRLLKGKHIYLDEHKIYIPGEIAKTGLDRYARIPRSFLPTLDYVRSYPPGKYLFCSPCSKSKPTGVNYFARKIRKVMNELGFDSSVKPCYSWRHTSAMEGIKNGVPIEQMKDQWGHASLDQFIQYIRQFGVDDRNEFAEKFKGI